MVPDSAGTAIWEKIFGPGSPPASIYPSASAAVRYGGSPATGLVSERNPSLFSRAWSSLDRISPQGHTVAGTPSLGLAARSPTANATVSGVPLGRSPPHRAPGVPSSAVSMACQLQHSNRPTRGRPFIWMESDSWLAPGRAPEPKLALSGLENQKCAIRSRLPFAGSSSNPATPSVLARRPLVPGMAAHPSRKR